MDIKKVKSKSLTPTEGQLGIKDLIEGRKDTYLQLLPQGTNVNRFIKTAMIAVHKNPKIRQCSPSSILLAIDQAATYGLEVNSQLGEAAMIPYGNEVQFIIEYRGLLKLAWNSGLIRAIDYDKICKNDEYEYTKGISFNFSHKPNLQDRGEAIAYYAIAELTTGATVMMLMGVDDIREHGKRFSKGYGSKSSPWQTDFEAMAIKTVLRQLCDKKLPKSDGSNGQLLRSAAHIEDIPEDDVKTSMDMEIKIEPDPEPEPEPEPDPKPKAKKTRKTKQDTEMERYITTVKGLCSDIRRRGGDPDPIMMNITGAIAPIQGEIPDIRKKAIDKLTEYLATLIK